MWMMMQLTVFPMIITRLSSSPWRESETETTGTLLWETTQTEEWYQVLLVQRSSMQTKWKCGDRKNLGCNYSKRYGRVLGLASYWAGTLRVLVLQPQLVCTYTYNGLLNIFTSDYILTSCYCTVIAGEVYCFWVKINCFEYDKMADWTAKDTVRGHMMLNKC